MKTQNEGKVNDMTNVERWKKQRIIAKTQLWGSVINFEDLSKRLIENYRTHGFLNQEDVRLLNTYLNDITGHNSEVRMYDRIIAEELVEGGE